jgi:hypothetical protein
MAQILVIHIIFLVSSVCCAASSTITTLRIYLDWAYAERKICRLTTLPERQSHNKWVCLERYYSLLNLVLRASTVVVYGALVVTNYFISCKLFMYFNRVLTKAKPDRHAISVTALIMIDTHIVRSTIQSLEI